MYLLDTNIISDMRKALIGRANPGVLRWSESVDSPLLFLSAITVMEMEIGVLAKIGKDPAQGRIFWEWLHEQVLHHFAGRILEVDTEVALRCAALHVLVNVATPDSLIAATALVHGLTVVTRNEKDFLPMGVKVLNPWEE
jgi:predicted nucleic acid-binding protein